MRLDAATASGGIGFARSLGAEVADLEVCCPRSCHGANGCCRYSPEPVARGALALWSWSTTWGVAAVPVAPSTAAADQASVVLRFQPLLGLLPQGSSPQGLIPDPLVSKPFSAQAVRILPMTSYEPNFWTTIATFCRELAPVSGALLDSIGQTAAAIDRAGSQSQSPRPRLEGNRMTMPP